MKTKVAFVIDTIESPTAGTERQVLRLIRGLDPDRFAPVLCCLRPSRWVLEEWDGCPVHVVNCLSFKHPRAWLAIGRFAAWLRRERVRAVQTHFRDASIVGLTAAWLARVPVIVATRRGRPLYKGLSGHLLFQALNAIPTHFVANSAFSRDLAAAREGLSPQRFTIIPNALDWDAHGAPTPERRKAARERLGIDDSLPVVGIVANLNPWKRHDLLLEAAAILGENGRPVRVVSIGGGGRDGLGELARRLGLGERVLFAGQRGDVPELLPAFDIGVLCSDFESSSNALLEYLAAGIPVVCTDVGGASETVAPGVCGYLTPPGDAAALAGALEALLADAPEREAFARFTDSLRKRHDPHAMVAAHARLYAAEEPSR